MRAAPYVVDEHVGETLRLQVTGAGRPRGERVDGVQEAGAGRLDPSVERSSTEPGGGSTRVHGERRGPAAEHGGPVENPRRVSSGGRGSGVCTDGEAPSVRQTAWARKGPVFHEELPA